MIIPVRCFTCGKVHANAREIERDIVQPLVFSSLFLSLFLFLSRKRKSDPSLFVEPQKLEVFRLRARGALSFSHSLILSLSLFRGANTSLTTTSFGLFFL